ncbi:Stachyose synthase [Nymphaea thermarum]|nr:Stachyose synthase [Nymphaea thermarum]
MQRCVGGTWRACEERENAVERGGCTRGTRRGEADREGERAYQRTAADPATATTTPSALFLFATVTALHPGTDGHVILCVESGSTKVKISSFTACAYVRVSDNPYVLMKEAYGASRVHLNTFRLLEEKSVPSVVDKFGWCTWDAFYLTVNPVGVWHGVKEFAEGGVPLRFLIIDDGWQSISLDGENPFEDAKNLVLGGTQMTARLYRFEECEKLLVEELN